MNATTYPTHVIEHASTRPLDPEHSQPADVALASQLEDMAALYRLHCEQATPADLERLEISREMFKDADTYHDLARETAGNFALEFRVARWADSDHDPYATSTDAERPLARAAFLLTFGGPNVRLVVDFDPMGDNEAQRITLERAWGDERDRAECVDADALGMADSFVRAFFVGE